MGWVSYTMDEVGYTCEEKGKKSEVLAKVEARLKKEYPNGKISDIKFVGDHTEEDEEK